MSMRKKLLFRHSGKTRERREDHRSQEKKFTSFKVWNERRKDHRDLSQKENLQIFEESNKFKKRNLPVCTNPFFYEKLTQ
jgi:hypothetical protein